MTSEPLILVYRITCLVNSKVYFGVTKTTIAQRWKAHLKEARAKRFDTVLYRAIRKYGSEKFSIEIVYHAINAREAQICERALIAQYGTLAPSGMNTSTGGEKCAGRAVTPEIRAKISESKRGVKMSAETRRKMSEMRHGKKRSPEIRENMKRLAHRPDVRAKFLAHYQKETTREACRKGGTAAMKLLWQDPWFRARRAADIAALNARKKSLANLRAMVRELPTEFIARAR